MTTTTTKDAHSCRKTRSLLHNFVFDTKTSVHIKYFQFLTYHNQQQFFRRKIN